MGTTKLRFVIIFSFRSFYPSVAMVRSWYRFRESIQDVGAKHRPTANMAPGLQKRLNRLLDLEVIFDKRGLPVDYAN
jgi:hypothetical protein